MQPLTVNQLNVSSGPETALEAARRLAFALTAQQAAIAAPAEPPTIDGTTAPETKSSPEAISTILRRHNLFEAEAVNISLTGASYRRRRDNAASMPPKREAPRQSRRREVRRPRDRPRRALAA